MALIGGRILAIKGIGGFHLVADATNVAAVAELRRRKARDAKPFAVMVETAAVARRICALDDAATEVLSSIRRPIVIAPRRAGNGIAPDVAPGLADLGVMLPYSPLHHLILAGTGRPLVMTSGNLSDEPIAHDDDDAVRRLGPLVDGLLSHDRAIHIRCDDSVVRALPSRTQLLRRSRGFAPEPMSLPFDVSVPVLAVGAELKNTVSVAKHNWVVASHHIGDLEHLATYRSFVQAVNHLPQLYGVVAEIVAHDMHPEYLSSKYAEELDLAVVAVQHHHAHIAACMVEHGRIDAVLGIAYDGLGYGPDSTLWGGELLVADFASSVRVGHLRPMRMPGGVAAIREPWRMAAAWATAAAGRASAERHLCSKGIDERAARIVVDLADSSVSPVTTSAGRLFDAVAALLTGRRRVSYEAQAAIELEVMARSVGLGTSSRYDGAVSLTHQLDQLVLDPSPLIAALLCDIDAGVEAPLISAGFHDAFARATVEAACVVASGRGLDTVVLTGGVFQNARLAGVVEQGLRAAGLDVLVHSAIPPNDGGISIGQAAIAAFALA